MQYAGLQHVCPDVQYEDSLRRQSQGAEVSKDVKNQVYVLKAHERTYVH